MRLNLGCADRLEPGYTNVDMRPPADVIFDLNQYPWPWDDSSVSHIMANDVVEHIRDCDHSMTVCEFCANELGTPMQRSFYAQVHVMSEAWRILKDGGTFSIKVPTTDGPGAWCDPTHRSYWNRLSFEYFTKDHFSYTRGRQWTAAACYEVVSQQLKTWPNGVVDLNITLRAVKP